MKLKPKILVIYVPNGEILRFDTNSKCDYGIDWDPPVAVWFMKKNMRVTYINVPFRYEENDSN
jgi:hypothetical protein